MHIFLVIFLFDEYKVVKENKKKIDNKINILVTNKGNDNAMNKENNDNKKEKLTFLYLIE